MKIKITIWVLIACIVIPSVTVFAIRQIEVSNLNNMIDQEESKNKQYMEQIDDLNNQINNLQEVPLLRGVWTRITPVVGWDTTNFTLRLNYPKTMIINNDSTSVLVFDYEEGTVETYYSSLINYGNIIFLDKNGTQRKNYKIEISTEETNGSYYRTIEIETGLADVPTLLYGQNEDYYSV